MGYPHSYNDVTAAERPFMPTNEDEQRLQLRAEIFRQLQEQDHQHGQEHKQDDMISQQQFGGTGSSTMMGQFGAGGPNMQGGFGSGAAPSAGSTSQQTSQQLMAAEQALQLGVTPAMLEQMQRQPRAGGGGGMFDNMNVGGGAATHDDIGQGSSFNRFGGGGMNNTSAVGGRPSTGGGPLGAGSGGFGGTNSGFNQNGPSFTSKMGGGGRNNDMNTDMYGTNTQGLASSIAQEAEYLRHKSNELQDRQAQLMAAAGLQSSRMMDSNDSGFGGMAGLPNQNTTAMSGMNTGAGRRNFVGGPSFLDQKIQPSSLGGGMGMGMGGGFGNQQRFGGPEEDYPGVFSPGGMEMMPASFNMVGGGNMRPPMQRVATLSKKRAKTFPEKLMQVILDNPNEDVLAWLPDGKSFVVVDPEAFVEKVLKTLFKGCKYASFVRKLHRWGFVRLTSGTGTDCFHHPLFRKGRTDLCCLIKCQPRNDSASVKNAQAMGGPKTPTPKDVTVQNALAAKMIDDKPPSLAGVEKFIISPVPTCKNPPPVQEDKGESDGSVEAVA